MAWRHFIRERETSRRPENGSTRQFRTEEPDSYQVHRAYAQWGLDQGDLVTAKRHVEKAAKLRPDSREVLRLQKLIADAENPDKVSPPDLP